MTNLVSLLSEHIGYSMVIKNGTKRGIDRGGADINSKRDLFEQFRIQ